MLNAYRTYVLSRTEQNAEILWKAILEFDFFDYEHICKELKSIWESASIAVVNQFLTSNGTTSGTPKSYAVGPLFDFWLPRIEWMIKYQSINKTPSIYIREGFPYFLDTKIGFSEKKSILVDGFINLDFRYVSKSLNLMEDVIKNFYEEKGKFWFITQPNKYLYLFGHPEFRDLLKNNENKIKVVSTDWEPFFNHPFVINDQMINWVTMVNFYTCKYNTKHFLPLFLIENNSIINLLNLANKKELPIDDKVIINKQRQLCQCGKYYLPFNMISHINCAINTPNGYFNDVNIANSLVSTYYNLQFIQKSKFNIDILFTASNSFKDKDFLVSIWENQGMQVSFYPERYLVMGVNKILPFYNNKTTMSYYSHKFYKVIL